MTDNILDMVRKVANLRFHLEAQKEYRRELLAKWEVEHASLLDTLAERTEALADAEADLRAEAIKIYQETGSKTPGPGVGIRLVTKLDYAPGVALAWATEHGLALKLDVPTFEKIVKASPLPFVNVSQEATATIAQDLEAALKEVSNG